MKILVLSSLSWSLINFRGALIARMVAEGHDVVACAPDREEEVVSALSCMGVRFVCTPMARAGTNPFRDVATILRYVKLLRTEQPDAVVAYTQKPIIYGGIANRIAVTARFHVIMSGLGYVFSDVADQRPGLRRAVSWLYRAGLRGARSIFVFNSDDRRLMLDQRIVDPGQPVVQVPGSGVDTRYFDQRPMPMESPFTFLMMGRLMRDKGVGEYVAAARAIRADHPDTRFLLLGRPEAENPTGYGPDAVAAWQEEGLIEILPETRDVRPCLASAHVFVLPSYYREGLPRTILEALSTGRPVITTDMPGCRDPIREGENGKLVPPRDAAALAKTMASFIGAPERLREMGRRARESAVAGYDVDQVNDLLLRTMDMVASNREQSNAPVVPLRPLSVIEA